MKKKKKKRNKEEWNEIILEVLAWIFLMLVLLFVKEFLMIKK